MPLDQSTPEPPIDFDEELAATVSRLFWLEDRSKTEIADEFGLSRFKVARILDDARRYGIARIEIVEPTERIGRLAGQVREAYGLTDVRLSVRPITTSGGLAELGAVAASFLSERIRPGMVLGLGWGSTMAEVVAHLAPGGPADVVQLAGGFASSDDDFNGNQLVMAASAVLGGNPYLLHAPALVSSVEARTVLRADETIARTVAKYQELAAIVTGIGVWKAHSSSALYRGNVLSASVHAELRKWDVVGDTCCHFIDAHGTVIAALEGRVTGISVTEIRSTPVRVAVAGGADKLAPIRAALASGLPNVLITDLSTARALLATGIDRDGRKDRDGGLNHG
ncbi:DNA-binding transcriptional regulator LsrR (DeoR family) [Nakamurella sp. UYEF19]|uniref:sugar-binding transcriptional regulator n=1 Tax=Nakamurella sp. UYEF19 TaxID=1756392 RepID=UPI003392DA4F